MGTNCNSFAGRAIAVVLELAVVAGQVADMAYPVAVEEANVPERGADTEAEERKKVALQQPVVVLQTADP